MGARVIIALRTLCRVIFHHHSISSTIALVLDRLGSNDRKLAAIYSSLLFLVFLSLFSFLIRVSMSQCALRIARLESQHRPSLS